MRIHLIGKTGRMGQAIQRLHPEIVSIESAEVIVDFSHPDQLEKTLELAQKFRIPLVVGTTGFTETQHLALAKTGSVIPLLHSPNFSLGIALCKQLTAILTKALPTASRVVVEAHHRLKKDRPSGTALALAMAAGDAEILSIRGGSIVGEHTIRFIADGEQIELKHLAEDRNCFAKGALDVAQWLIDKPPKLYKMEEYAISLFGIREQPG